MMWVEMKQLWEEGLTKYRKQWWNWLDFAMICLYLYTIAIRIDFEPMLVAEALFALGNVFSFARIIYLFQTHPDLGPLQVEDTDVAEQHSVTLFVGRALFITYHMTSIIVLLNMLIAMMSHTFQIINFRSFKSVYFISFLIHNFYTITESRN